MPLILAEELDTLTVQEIQEWNERAGDGTRIYIEVIDKPNLTSERLKQLQCLVRQRDELIEYRAVDADELNAKLRQISPRRSPASSDIASTPVTAGADLTEKETIEGVQRIAYRDYKKLESVGGRPSREIHPDPGPCPASKSDVAKRYHVSDHWDKESGLIERELKRWLDFRWHQFEMRTDSKMFNIYKDAVHKHRQAKGIDWAVELQLDRQTKLDEWREYYIYEHRKRRALENKLELAKLELEHAKERTRNAERNGSVRIPETAFLGRWGELIVYEKKILRAQKEVEMAQKRLEVLRVEESLSASKRKVLTEQAEKDLESAHKRLEADKSDKLDQLNMEFERTREQEIMGKCQGKVDYANTLLEQLDTLLEWINGQIAVIAAEYASSSWSGKHNRDLLDGWERYYVHMRERLHAKQDRDAEEQLWYAEMGWKKREKTKAEEIREDLLFPQDRISPLKALLAWIEREFPDIAAKYALFGSDSQSNGNHQDQDQDQDQIDLPNSKPSPSEPARKTSRSDVGKSTQRKGRSARKRSPLSQVQPSKVSKPSQKRKRPLDQKLSTTCYGEWLLEGRTDDVGQVDEQSPRKVAVRRSERISQQTRNPAPPSLGLIRPPEICSRRLPEGTVRRSARLLDRTKKIRSLESDLDVKPVRSSTTAGRKSPLRTMVHTNTAYTGTPQGILRTRRWKANSKKGKNV